MTKIKVKKGRSATRYFVSWYSKAIFAIYNGEGDITSR